MVLTCSHRISQGHVCQQQVTPGSPVRFSLQADRPNSEVVSIGDVSVQAKDDPSHLAACFATCQNFQHVLFSTSNVPASSHLQLSDILYIYIYTYIYIYAYVQYYI